MLGNGCVWGGISSEAEKEGGVGKGREKWKTGASLTRKTANAGGKGGTSPI